MNTVIASLFDLLDQHTILLLLISSAINYMYISYQIYIAFSTTSVRQKLTDFIRLVIRGVSNITRDSYKNIAIDILKLSTVTTLDLLDAVVDMVDREDLMEILENVNRLDRKEVEKWWEMRREDV